MKLIFEKSVTGRSMLSLPKNDVETLTPDASLCRKAAPALPEIAEVDFIRHYMELSRQAYGVDNGFYPLGSCTMKYNPRINEDTAVYEGFTGLHPFQPAETVQGALKAMYTLQKDLCALTGMDAVTLQPAAGAHGEWTGLKLIKAYHQANGSTKRVKILVPDSAHGTNPASAAMAGFQVVAVPSKDGNVDVEALKGLVGEDTAALMLTNPNTLGLFEKNILQIAEVVHGAGGLVYYDGANFNAIMGMARPGDMGFDVIHFNLHKTFSTPHGGGGPGSGPVGCKAKLAAFLPKPVVREENGKYILDYDRPQSIGKVRSFYGNFLVVIRALTYVTMLGCDGLKEASCNAVLNANYMLAKLNKVFDLNSPAPCMHEFVLSMEKLKEETGCSAMDVSKSLLDYGIHPPTMYFPLIVHEALMFEPTETESVETLDHAIDVLAEIKAKAYEDPQWLHDAPHTTTVFRPDEVTAARNPILKFSK